MSTALLPDLLLLLSGFAVIGADLFSKDRNSSLVYNLCWVLVLGVIAGLLFISTGQSSVYLHHYTISGFSTVFKLIFSVSLFFTVILSRSYFEKDGNLRGRLKSPGEFYGILIFCTFGMFTLVSSSDFITFFVGMELATIPLYALTAFYKDDKKSSEAATKYILMGALSTGVFLFGTSLIYGAVGSLDFENFKTFSLYTGGFSLLTMGSLMVIGSICFKIAAAPFHMWAPDVYDGAPTPVTAFLSVASKSAGVAALLILFYGPLSHVRETSVYVLMVIACISMVVGNLGALRQHSLRRFMGYSSVAQAGYLLVAFAGNGTLVHSSIIFYLIVYSITNLCTFFIISIIGRQREETFESLRGLSKQSPMLAGILALCMFSLAGIPPLAGFTGKFFLFASAAEGGFYGLVVFAALNSTVSLYYYLVVLKEAYINKPEGTPGPLQITFAQRWSLILLTTGMVLFGLMPQFSSHIAGLFQ